MANQILDRAADAVTFEVAAQSYKAGRFTMPAEVLRLSSAGAGGKQPGTVAAITA